MYSVVLTSLLTAGGLAASDCGIPSCGVDQYPSPPKMTKFANIIAPLIPCADVHSAVPPKPGVCGCAGNGVGYGGCGGIPLPNWYYSPYSHGGCAIPGWPGFFDCGGVLVAQVYAPGVFYGGIGSTAGVVAPALTPGPLHMRQMPKQPDGAKTGIARVMTKAPTDVRIQLNGKQIARTGIETTFRTPELVHGQTYCYVFTAEVERDGRTVTETRKVEVHAGAQVVVDFSSIKGPGLPPAIETSRVAVVTLKVPENAQLFVDGRALTLPGGVRTFTTPTLEPGQKHFYEVKAQVRRDGALQTETRKVYVQPGQHLEVDFRQLLEVRTASK